MKRFRFPLKTLLWLRQQREQAARRSVADLFYARKEARAAVERARAAVLAAEADQARARDAMALKAAAAVVEYRREQAFGTQRRLVEIQTRLAAAQARFLLLRRERRIVERLRERRLASHRTAEARIEQARLDELAIIRHNRREPWFDR